jgi:peroxiredoxin
MNAWGKDQNCAQKVDMVADGDGAFAKATGLELDLQGKGLGVRNQRFSMLVEDGTVKVLNIDPAGSFEKTSAEALLSQI